MIDYPKDLEAFIRQGVDERRRHYQDVMLRRMQNAVNPPIVIEHHTVVAMKRVRRERAERLRALRLRPWWRKVWDGVVYVVTGREP